MPQSFDLPGRFTALDGWRGIAAVMVAAYHFHTVSHVEGLSLVRNAYLLVDLFFVLSGFIMAYAYGGKLASVRDGLGMMYRRIGRLWPLHMAVLGALVALELIIPLIAWVTGAERSASGMFDPESSARLSGIVSNVLLVHGLGLHDQLTWNMPSWSVSVEVAVYAVFAVATVMSGRLSMLAAAGLAVLGFGILASFSQRGIAVDGDLGFFRCLYGFFIGQITFRMLAYFPKRLPAATAIEVSAVAVIAGFVTLAGRTPAEFAAPIVFVVPLLVFAREQGRVSRLLTTAPLRALGLWSYSIYMVHTLVIVAADRAVTLAEQKLGLVLTTAVEQGGTTARALVLGGPFVMDAVVIVYLAIVIVLAGFAWRFIEMPAQAWWNGRRQSVNRDMRRELAPVG